MATPPPKPQKPPKPGKPSLPAIGGSTGVRQLPTRPPIPAGRSYRERPQSTRPGAGVTSVFANVKADSSSNISAMNLDQPLPPLPTVPKLSSSLSQLPPRRTNQNPNSNLSTCSTPPLTPTSSRGPPSGPTPSGRALPTPIASLPEPNQPLPTPPAKPVKPAELISSAPTPLPRAPPKPPVKPQSLKEERQSSPVVPPPRLRSSVGDTTIQTNSSSSKRVSVRNSGLENVLAMRLPGGPPASQPPQTPPPEVSASPPEKRKSSKLFRPSKKKGPSKNTFGTLPTRFMGDKLKDKSKDSKEQTDGGTGTSHNDNLPKISSPTDAQSDSPSDGTKWKRGAEAEAILKLINETKGDQSSAVTTTAKGKGTAPSEEAIDAEAIMKILGLEEPGIKLPEKHKDGEEKALDPVSELQLTERNFIADLGLLNETFVKPIRAQNILPAATIEAMSINIERLISLHRELYKNFLTDSSMLGIATTFSDSLIAEMERLYTVYMGHYESSLALFHEKRDNVTQFRKYLKQREDVSDKSIPNLMVTPVQRVCKYELMLASIKKSLLKQAEPNDKEIQDHANLLQKKIELLNETLQNVDRRRAAADNWDKINQLEKTLLLSESLSKVGRIILLTIETNVKVGDEEKQFRLVLFNDQLIRAKVAKKSKSRLLDSIPLNQLSMIDISSTEATDKFSFYLIPSDPRLAIWTVHFSSEATKKEWMKNLQPRVLPFERFCESWGIPKTQNESLLAADGGRWPQEFVNDCRLYVTTSFLCVQWKMFGIEERELVPLEILSNVQQTHWGKEKALRISASSWKQDYTFTSLQLSENTDAILNQLLQNSDGSITKRRMKVDRRMTICQANPFLLSAMEWNSIWSEAKQLKFQAKEEIISTKQSHPYIYQLVSGRVMSSSSPPVLISAKGAVFGASSFFETTAPLFNTVADGAVVVLQLKRDDLVANCDTNHLMKFFATLAKRSAPV